MAQKLFPTRIDLPQEKREAVVVAMGTVRMASAASRLPEYPPEAVEGLQCVKALADRYASLAATTRAAIDTAAEHGDMGTSDLFTEVSRGLDKALWFLEAHLQV